jgi:hypothetical protein
MKQSIWRERSASDVIDQHPNIAAGGRQGRGVAQNTISKLLRGPAESDAMAGKPSTTK